MVFSKPHAPTAEEIAAATAKTDRKALSMQAFNETLRLRCGPELTQPDALLNALNQGERLVAVAETVLVMSRGMKNLWEALTEAKMSYRVRNRTIGLASGDGEVTFIIRGDTMPLVGMRYDGWFDADWLRGRNP